VPRLPRRACRSMSANGKLAPKKYGDHISDDVQGGAAIKVMPSIIIRVSEPPNTDVRAESEEADGVLSDANGDIVRKR